jgi:hypothetical protein
MSPTGGDLFGWYNVTFSSPVPAPAPHHCSAAAGPHADNLTASVQPTNSSPACTRSTPSVGPTMHDERTLLMSGYYLLRQRVLLTALMPGVVASDSEEWE